MGDLWNLIRHHFRGLEFKINRVFLFLPRVNTNYNEYQGRKKASVLLGVILSISNQPIRLKEVKRRDLSWFDRF